VSIDKKLNNRISPEWVLLGFLYQHSSHGYELHKRLSDEFGYIWHASQSQTYNILNRLESQAYISSTNIEQNKLPPRQLLHITAAGISRFDNWLNTPTKSSVHAIRVEFITRLYFLQQNYPYRTQEAIQIQAAEVRSAIKRLKVVLARLPESQIFNRLALEMRIKLLDSMITWLKECREVFNQKDSGGELHE
jgi:DNA-binding PadR family transcriptional regulator